MIQKTFLKTKDVCKVKFSVDVADANSVEILGLNNDWNSAVALKKKKDGTFSGEINLPKNTQHEFKYLINGGEWADDDSADGKVPNNFGGNNNLLVL
jgi:1,4-alpha-glucan branching enzyme